MKLHKILNFFQKTLDITKKIVYNSAHNLTGINKKYSGLAQR